MSLGIGLLFHARPSKLLNVLRDSERLWIKILTSANADDGFAGEGSLVAHFKEIQVTGQPSLSISRYV